MDGTAGSSKVRQKAVGKDPDPWFLLLLPDSIHTPGPLPGIGDETESKTHLATAE